MMERSRPLPSPALVWGSSRCFVALSGGAYAVTKIGSKNLRNGAVTNKKLRNGAVTNTKIKNKAVSTGKLRDGAVTAPKVGDGAIGTTELGDGAVTAAKLAPGERGEAYVSIRQAQVPLTPGIGTAVATLDLPAGSFIVTAATTLGGSQAGANPITCDLRDDGTVLTTGAGFVDVAVYMDTVTLTAASNGGTVTMTCDPALGAQPGNARSPRRA